MAQARQRKPREAPAVRDAMAFITGHIEREVFKPATALPTISRMARMAGVSYVSMWKAVAALKAQHVLDTRPGQPVMVRRPEHLEDPPESFDYVPSAKAKWQIVKKLIERDIFNGTYPSGTLLPSVKQLRSAYGISYSVLRKAMAMLAMEHIIVPRVHGYAAADLPASQRHRNRIVLIAPCSPKTEQIIGMSSEELVRCLEKECFRAKLVLQIVGYYPTEGSIRYIDFATGNPCAIADTEETFGYLCLVSYRESGWEDGLRRLAGIRKPVALIDQTSGLDPALTTMKNNRAFQVFSMCTTQKAGREMGRYLLGLGHRDVAYLSAFNKSTWSINRLAGLASVFESAGLRGGVHTVILDSRNPLENPNEGIAESRIERILDFYREQRQNMPSYFLPSFDRLFHTEEGILLTTLRDGVFRRYYEPLFRRAIQNKTVTAWVPANDHVAIMALEFLRRRGIACPGDLSLVGFDDTREALEHKLSSYNFNVPGLVNAVLRHLLDERVRKETFRPRAVEVDGMVIERGTSGRNPRAGIV